MRPRSRASLVTYLVYFVLISFYLLVNNFIYLRSEINAFNNDNLGAKVMAKIEAFVDRLLPKHVAFCSHRSEKLQAPWRQWARPPRT